MSCLLDVFLKQFLIVAILFGDMEDIGIKDNIFPLNVFCELINTSACV